MHTYLGSFHLPTPFPSAGDGSRVVSPLPVPPPSKFELSNSVGGRIVVAGSPHIAPTHSTEFEGWRSVGRSVGGRAHLFHKGNNEIVSVEKLPTCFIIRGSPAERGRRRGISFAMRRLPREAMLLFHLRIIPCATDCITNAQGPHRPHRRSSNRH